MTDTTGESEMRASDRGLAFIANEEGVILYAYVDFAGVKTIGVGHVMGAERYPTAPLSSIVMVGKTRPYVESDGAVMVISREDAMRLLRHDSGAAEAAVRRLVRVPLTQSQFDALVSFTFNAGRGALESSTLLKRLNVGDYASVPGEMARWNKYRKNGAVKVSETLAKRRRLEGEMFAASADTRNQRDYSANIQRAAEVYVDRTSPARAG